MVKKRIGRGQAHLPGSAEGHDDVVTGAESEIPELALEQPRPLVHEPDLVSLGVAVEIVHAGRCAAHAQGHVAVAEQGEPGRDWIGPKWGLGGAKGAVADGAEFYEVRAGRAQIFRPGNARRQEVVVEDRLQAGEALQPHQFLAVELAVGLAELGVALVGDFAELVIERHFCSIQVVSELGPVSWA
jgi:hypothetical protein